MSGRTTNKDKETAHLGLHAEGEGAASEVKSAIHVEKATTERLGVWNAMACSDADPTSFAVCSCNDAWPVGVL